jgi:hypothetical protein
MAFTPMGSIAFRSTSCESIRVSVNSLAVRGSHPGIRGVLYSPRPG